MQVGKIYRLRFPGLLARVIRYDPNVTPYSYLVESLFTRSRWWVDETGKPNNWVSPEMVVSRDCRSTPKSHEAEVGRLSPTPRAR